LRAGARYSVRMTRPFLAAILLTLAPATAHAPNRRTSCSSSPTIGGGTPSLRGSVVRTPHLDALAKQGVRFTQCRRHHVDLLRQPGHAPDRASTWPATASTLRLPLPPRGVGRDVPGLPARGRLPHRVRRQVRRREGGGKGVRLPARLRGRPLDAGRQGRERFTSRRRTSATRWPSSRRGRRTGRSRCRCRSSPPTPRTRRPSSTCRSRGARSCTRA